MATISRDDVERIAKLARVRLEESEISDATTKLNNILEHFAAIQSIATDDVVPANDISGLQNITRVDEAKDEVLCTHADLLAEAPRTVKNHIQVPAVFE